MSKRVLLLAAALMALAACEKASRESKRQIWDVYYYRFADCQGWVSKYGIIRVKMSEKDFAHFFGAYEIR